MDWYLQISFLLYWGFYINIFFRVTYRFQEFPKGGISYYEHLNLWKRRSFIDKIRTRFFFGWGQIHSFLHIQMNRCHISKKFKEKKNLYTWMILYLPQNIFILPSFNQIRKGKRLFSLTMCGFSHLRARLWSWVFAETLQKIQPFLYACFSIQSPNNHLFFYNFTKKQIW